MSMFSEWNPDLMKVFSPKQLILLENLLQYAVSENDIAFQDSMWKPSTYKNDDDCPPFPGENRPAERYYEFEEILNKLKIYFESDSLPEGYFTLPKYSCNVSNQFYKAIGE